MTVTVPSVRPLLIDESVPLHVLLNDNVVFQDELELDHEINADDVPLDIASIEVNEIVLLETIVVPATGDMVTIGDVKSTVPLSHVIGPTLPIKSTILHPRVKVVVEPLVPGGIKLAPDAYVVPFGEPSQKHSAYDAPIPPESTTLVRWILPVDPK